MLEETIKIIFQFDPNRNEEKETCFCSSRRFNQEPSKGTDMPQSERLTLTPGLMIN
jgi:hypothetical protein